MGTFTQSSVIIQNINLIGYRGPGDVLPGASIFCGTRAYSFATLGTNAIRLRRSSDQVEQDFATVRSGVNPGGLDLAAITTFKGAASLFVVKLYDQLGGGSTADLVQATAGNQPAFTLSGLGTLPTIDFTAASSHKLANSIGVFNQPFTLSFVSKFTGSSQSSLYDVGNSQMGYQYHNPSANQLAIFQGTSIAVTVSDNIFHAIMGVHNVASSNLRIDSTDNTGTLNSASMNGDILGGIGSPLQGAVTEFARWPIALTTGQLDAMDANQSAYYGI